MKVNMKKVIEALPSDCRRLSRVTRSIWIFRMPAPEISDDEHEVVVTLERPHHGYGAIRQRVSMPSVWPKDSAWRQGAVLSDDPNRVVAWLTMGLET